MMRQSIRIPLLAIRMPVVAFLAAGLLSACTYRGTPTTPVERSLTWFSYLNGDGIREDCRPETPDRYRFVYNAIFIEQVRAYDLVRNGETGEPRLDTRVFGPSDLGQFTLSGPLDILAPWQPKQATTVLRDQDLAPLEKALADSAAFEPLTGSLQLHSDNFYWIVTACRGGKFTFNAFRWPSDRFAGLRFPDFLSAWDTTGVPANPPSKVDPNILHQASSGKKMSSVQRFNLTADAGGLKWILRLF